MEHCHRFTAPPPDESIQRVADLPGFALHPSSEIRNARISGDVVELETPNGRFEVDFVILGTGFVTDLRLRPELAALVDHIALWRDRYTPPEQHRNAALGRSPYLGEAFQYLEKAPGSAPWVSQIREYGFGSMASVGPICVGLNGMTFRTDRLVRGITRDLFTNDAQQYIEGIERIAER